MATPTIRGHQAKFTLLRDGAPVTIDSIQRVSMNQDSSFSRQFFVGNPIPEGDQSFEGWSGSLDMQVRDGIVDEFIDALVANNLAGINISDYNLIITELYTDGTQKSYAYDDCQFRMSRDQGGLTEKVSKRLDFQAAVRIAL